MEQCVRMATLLSINTREIIPLLSHHTFGRVAELVDRVVAAPQVSKIHAVIEWRSDAWFIRDLGGRNGTSVNATLAKPGINTRVKPGDIIQFANCHEEQLCVIDIDPPLSQLIGMNPQSPTIILEEFNLLPDQETPQAALFFSNFSNQWHLETYAGHTADDVQTSISVSANSRITIGLHCWLLHIQPEYSHTQTLRQSESSLNTFEFNFELSLDEEHTVLTLRNKYINQEISLGERTHHYLLYQLATLRLEHESAGFCDAERGWADRDLLCRQLGLDISHLNILLFRARKQLASALQGFASVDQLIENRCGQIRLNHANINIYKHGAA